MNKPKTALAAIRMATKCYVEVQDFDGVRYGMRLCFADCLESEDEEIQDTKLQFAGSMA